MSDFSCETSIKKTRKKHICEHCEKPIAVGSSAERISGVWDGDFGTVYMHSDCAAAGKAYATMTGYWGDEWSWLHQLDDQEDHKWLAKEFPTVAERMGRRANA